MVTWIEQLKQFLSNPSVGQLPPWGVWSYLLLAALVAIEGPLATLLGAAASSAGLMNPYLVFVAASTGNLTADTLWYTAGRLGKMDWVMRLGRRLRIKPDYLQQLENELRLHAPVILFISKLTVSPMIPALIATGLIKYPWRRWFPFVFAGEMIWTGSLVTLGYFGVQAITKVELGIEHVILASSILFIGLVLWFGRQFLKKAFKQTGSDGAKGENTEES